METGRKLQKSWRQRSELKSLSPTEFPVTTEFKVDTTYEVAAVPTGVAFSEGRVYTALFGGFSYIGGFPYIEGGGIVALWIPLGTRAVRASRFRPERKLPSIPISGS